MTISPEEAMRAIMEPRLYVKATKEDRIKSVKAIVKRHPELTIAQIAERIGYSVRTIQRYLRHCDNR